MKEKICSFFGQNNLLITDELYAVTSAEIMHTIALGCRVFYFSGKGAFDGLCYQIVTKIRTEYPCLGIKRVLCAPKESPYPKTKQYFHRKYYDEIAYLPPNLESDTENIKKNAYTIIKSSDFVVFYVEKEASAEYNAYEYAQKRKKRVINLCTKINSLNDAKDRA